MGHNLAGWERLHDSYGGEQDKRCGFLACLGGKSLGSLVGNKTQRFPDAAGFLHCLCLVRNSCFAMLLQKFHQLIESFRSDFWPGMVHDAGISPCVTGVFIPALVQQLTEAYSTFSRMTLEVRKNKADDVFFLIHHLLV